MPRVSILSFYYNFIYDFFLFGYITHLYVSSYSNTKCSDIVYISFYNYYYF